MTSIIDLAGSTIIGATVIGALIGIMVLLSGSTQEITAEVNAQETMADFVKTVQWDLAKVGNRVSGAAVLVAEPDRMVFRGDIDNNGSIDTVAYVKTSKALRTKTENPNDFMLYRLVFKGAQCDTTRLNVGLTTFSVSYLDSTGGSTTNANLVRGFTIAAAVESPYASEGVYSGVSWQNTIYPRNLNVTN
jgi:hypothetical protein